MNIYVYADESGVFDKLHNSHFVFGGLIFLSKESKDNENRKYINVERTMRKTNHRYKNIELKACHLENKDKNKLFRSLNKCFKYGVVVHQNRVMDEIFLNKKSKQRYLDYVYKIGLKRALEKLINDDLINPEEVNSLIIKNDEHSTATNGIYELKEGLEAEFKNGTFNWKYNKYFPPLFSNLSNVQLDYSSSEKVALIRSADIVANKIYFHATQNNLYEISNKIHLIHLP